MRKIFRFLLFIFLIPTAGWPQGPGGGPAKELAIAFSANVHGEVEPCG